MKVLDIRKSNQKHKKYSADVIINGQLYNNVNFGDTRYQHYKDSTPLKLFSHLDHNDKDRRDRFYVRHKSNTGPAGMLSKKFLW
jgi:hypothetical protein